ncbi:MAG: SDR family NAD(P)-dependent oxidoreductase [Porticoccaceae bacterium]
MANEFEGQVALVTGVTGGIGYAVAKLLSSRGAQVVLGGRNGDKLEEIKRDIPGASVSVFDLGAAGSIDRAIDAIVKEKGRLDILAHVAGIYPASLVADLDDDYVGEMLAVNLQGAIRLCKAVSRQMRSQGFGAIVNVSSLASEKPVPGLSVYAASKAGLDAFSKALAHEIAPKVRVNIVAPGPTRTETVEALMAADHTGAAANVTNEIPLGRLGESAEIAEAIAFMASNRASFITGAVLHVNGGSLMS